MAPLAYVKIHDAWMNDPELAELMANGRYDVVCWFFAAIAYAHSRDTDGIIDARDAQQIARLCAMTREAAQSAREAAQTARLVRARRTRGVVIIRAYRKWQITSDQRKEATERKRQSRAGHSGVTPLEKERKKERKGGVAAAAENGDDAPADGASTLDMDDLLRTASERIVHLNALDPGA